LAKICKASETESTAPSGASARRAVAALPAGELVAFDAAAQMPGKVFHAGTALAANGEVVTNGGRVLCAVGLGNSVRAAQQQAYALADVISWDGLQFRRDIGYRAIARES
jgi:phosphoribosylamine-glycine ligase